MMFHISIMAIVERGRAAGDAHQIDFQASFMIKVIGLGVVFKHLYRRFASTV